MWALVLLCSVMTLVFMDESCQRNQMTYSVWQMGRQKVEWRRRWSFIALSPACLRTSCMLPWWLLSNSEISCTTPWNGKPQRDGSHLSSENLSLQLWYVAEASPKQWQISGSLNSVGISHSSLRAMILLDVILLYIWKPFPWTSWDCSIFCPTDWWKFRSFF